jgi:hypothetical protein
VVACVGSPVVAAAASVAAVVADVALVAAADTAEAAEAVANELLRSRSWCCHGGR